ncbi:MAG: aldo/keto reductase [Chloroflexi bacterium]|nr:aldo/keto reductase [Chloroflexota bacterium]
MRYVELGKSGVQVSALGFGCMSLTPDRAEAGKAAVRRAYGLGVTLFDTADVYAQGQSEVILGQALREAGIARESVVIADKFGIVFQGADPAYAYKAYDLSAGYLKRSCEASLRRLGCDYIDLYQPHRIDYLTHPEEVARALEELKAEGKIRCAGVSNYSADEVRALSAYVRLESLQTQYNLLFLEPLESGLVAVTQEKQMAILCWSPLHQGALAGRAQGGHASWQAQRDEGAVAQLRPFAQAYGVTVGQLALAWLMQQPGPVIPLLGTANAAHVAEAVAAGDVRLERDDWYELLVIGRGRPLPWGQRPYLYVKER